MLLKLFLRRRFRIGIYNFFWAACFQAPFGGSDWVVGGRRRGLGVRSGRGGSDWVAGRCKGSDSGPRVRLGLAEGQIGAGARETCGGSDWGKLQTQSESSCSCNMNTDCTATQERSKATQATNCARDWSSAHCRRAVASSLPGERFRSFLPSSPTLLSGKCSSAPGVLLLHRRRRVIREQGGAGDLVQRVGEVGDHVHVHEADLVKEEGDVQSHADLGRSKYKQESSSVIFSVQDMRSSLLSRCRCT